MPDVRARLVWPVGIGPSLHTPTAVVDKCGRCSYPVYVDRVGTPDPPGLPVALVCVPCGLADPEMREGILRMHAAQRRLATDLPAAYARRPGKGGRDG